ncbi:hypothetical protein B0J17DRAFT_640860 [Rhizoctonia solani]|nr:hypothetical protein B0J17DRAFT_640860 [Rhizoctonia solani]
MVAPYFLNNNVVYSSGRTSAHPSSNFSVHSTSSHPAFTTSIHSTCRLHTDGISIQCMDCLALAGIVLNPYAAPAPVPELQKAGPNNMIPSGETAYMHKMKFALAELDLWHRFVPDGTFLDLGCCPGGFSTYILTKHPNAQGMGVSLPPTGQGRHSLAVPLDLRDRLQVHWEDITMFDHTSSLVRGCYDTTAFKTSPIPPRAFDFVIADGHQPPCMSAGDPRAYWSRDRLLVSQLLAALRAIKLTGTLLVKLSLEVSVPLMERIVLALSRLTPIPIRAVKPISIYPTKGTFYVLLHAPDPFQCFDLTRGLEKLWYVMTFGGPNGLGRGLNESDMDDIATYAEVFHAKPELNMFFHPIKEIRKAAKALGL